MSNVNERGRALATLSAQAMPVAEGKDATNLAEAIIDGYSAKYSPRAKTQILSMLRAKSTAAERKDWWRAIIVIVGITGLALVAEHSIVSKTKRKNAQATIRRFDRAICEARSSLHSLNEDDDTLKYLAFISGIFESKHQQRVQFADPKEIFDQWRKGLVQIEKALAEISARTKTATIRFKKAPSSFEAISKITAILSRNLPEEWPPLRRAVYWLWDVWEGAQKKAPTTKSIVVAAGHRTANVDDTIFNRFLIKVLQPIAPSYKWNQVAQGKKPRSYLADIRFDLLPVKPSFIGRVCSGFAPRWGGLRTQSV